MDLFTPVALGSLQLRNRIVMAPMTRSRAGSDAVPTAVMVWPTSRPRDPTGWPVATS